MKISPSVQQIKAEQLFWKIINNHEKKLFLINCIRNCWHRAMDIDMNDLKSEKENTKKGLDCVCRNLFGDACQNDRWQQVDRTPTGKSSSGPIANILMIWLEGLLFE